jgi:hypothetical protein
MILLKLTHNNQDFTFCTNGKILPLNDINLPLQFLENKEAVNYLRGYKDAISEHGINFPYKVEFQENPNIPTE